MTLSLDCASAFEEFYLSRWLRTVRIAHAIAGSASIAEDLAQEAFVRVHDRWTSLNTPDAFLRTVLVNLCRSHLRRSLLERSKHPPSVAASSPGPELDETWLAICRLPFRQRAVLALRYYEDLPEREIACLLGCRIGTVKSAHHRALAHLREELA
jgi:RNA polymerase sigma-70 factor (sigma-E family)